jgi:hypothetical protein
VSAVLPELRHAFADAIHALAAEPTAENVVRYLLASRELERAHESEALELQPLAA